jgi:hypothetical protein
MNHLAVEIWHQVFTLACTDNGFTGRSLSLVSQYIHETSKPMKLQSLAVVGPNQIQGLARLIEHTAPSHRRVQYLFIDSGWSGGTVTSILKDVQSIVAALAPSLIILHLRPHFERNYPLLPISATFSSLTELTLDGPCKYDKLTELISTSMDATGTPGCLFSHLPNFPALRRLYLNNDIYDDLKNWVRLIARVAPSLTHLCIPGGKSYDHARTFLAALGPQTRLNDHGMVTLPGSHHIEIGVLPSTIEHVFFTPNPSHYSWCGTGAWESRMAERAFEDVVRVDERVHIHQTRTIDIGDLEMYWRDRVEGRERWGSGTVYVRRGLRRRSVLIEVD